MNLFSGTPTPVFGDLDPPTAPKAVPRKGAYLQGFEEVQSETRFHVHRLTRSPYHPSLFPCSSLAWFVDPHQGKEEEDLCHLDATVDSPKLSMHTCLP